MTPAPMVAYGYARVSTEEQVAGGVSVDAQRARIEQFCTGRGLQLAHTYVDGGVSGGVPLGDRPEGAKLLRQIAASRSRCAVVIVKLDRLSRNVRDFLKVIDDDIRDQNAALYIVDFSAGEMDATSAMGRMMLTQMAAFAELERGMIKDRVRAAMQYMRRQGRLVGWRPYGRRLVAGSDTHLEDDPDEQAVIAQIREARAAGVSIRGVAALLDATGIPARCRPWTAALVREARMGAVQGWPAPPGAEGLARLAGLVEERIGEGDAARPRTDREIAAALNGEGIPPHRAMWQKTSVHGIIHGTRVPMEKRKRRVKNLLDTAGSRDRA